MPRALQVLVVDDNPINLRVAVRMLQSMGHGGALATDGAKALRVLEKQKFDVVLMDVTMPGMDGLAALEAIRQRERQGSPKVPVIMATAHDLPSDRARFLALGADGYVAKPLDMERLQHELERVLTP